MPTKFSIIPSTFPTNGQDWFNYAAASNCHVQAVLKFKQQLDVSLLKEAVRASADLEPVLGCQFTLDEDRPYWQRIKDLDRIDWCPAEVTEEPEHALNRFLCSGLNTEEGPQIKTKLLRTAGQDCLAIKLNHTCGDGGALKEYIYLLAGIYSSLAAGKRNFRVNIEGKRDSGKLFAELGIADPQAHFDPSLANQPPTWAFPWNSLRPDPEVIKVSRKVISGNLYRRIAAYAKAKKVSVNDILLAAFYRCLFTRLQPAAGEPMEIMVTVDQRRYLPENKADAICNLSGAVRVKLGRQPAESFAKTLFRVNQEMQELKDGNPGLNSAILCELLGAMNFSQARQIFQAGRTQALVSGKCSPLLSNFGLIGREPVSFGPNRAEYACLISPALYAPGFMLGASAYNEALTLTVSFAEPGTDEKDVQEFLELFSRELANTAE